MTGLHTSPCLLHIYLIGCRKQQRGENNKGIVESIHRNTDDEGGKITCCWVSVGDDIRLGRRSVDAWAGTTSSGRCRPRCVNAWAGTMSGGRHRAHGCGRRTPHLRPPLPLGLRGGEASRAASRGGEESGGARRFWAEGGAAGSC
jgi:hypothetical protein